MWILKMNENDLCGIIWLFFVGPLRKRNLQHPKFSQLMTVTIMSFWLGTQVPNSEVKRELSTHLYDAKHNYSGTGSVTSVDIDLRWSQQFSRADSLFLFVGFKMHESVAFCLCFFESASVSSASFVFACFCSCGSERDELHRGLPLQPLIWVWIRPAMPKTSPEYPGFSIDLSHPFPFQVKRRKQSVTDSIPRLNLRHSAASPQQRLADAMEHFQLMLEETPGKFLWIHPYAGKTKLGKSNLLQVWQCLTGYLVACRLCQICQVWQTASHLWPVL